MTPTCNSQGVNSNSRCLYYARVSHQKQTSCTTSCSLSRQIYMQTRACTHLHNVRKNIDTTKEMVKVIYNIHGHVPHACN